ncbi:MliC family protein [Bartonella sp. F02]|uniref:MliC family protein n=1 Tax=Bartonella sp. F02 TaxID=2967262 RepID=UPI0022A8FF47|nr:MliC family protein [Bartonella sp. F02]MCZ2327899.1 MliC family protein [Bartonella sp. F02]
MKKTPLILQLSAFLSLSLFNLTNASAGSLVIEVSDHPQPTTQTISYQCGTGNHKEKVEATYLNANNIALVDFTWKNERVIGANVISATGAKYMGAQYIWWESKNEVTLYDLVNDPKEEKPILCVEESTLLF